MYLTIGVSVPPQVAQDSRSETISNCSSDFRSLVEALNLVPANQSRIDSIDAGVGEGKIGLKRRSITSTDKLNVELYEQQVFAIHKLSYIDKSNAGSSTDKVDEAIIGSARPGYYMTQAQYGMTADERVISNSVPVCTYRVGEIKLMPIVLDADLAVYSTPYLRELYPMDKTRITVAKERDQVLLVIRDHFSSEVDLYDSIRILVNNLDADSPKIVLNGREV